MNWSFRLRNLPKELKLLALLFILSMLFGYGASFILVVDQTSLSPSGIEENYNGNEDIDEAATIKFRKSKFEMLTSIHSHVFTLSLIFLATGTMAYLTGLPHRLKTFLIVEPLLSLIITFSSLIFLWHGHLPFRYLAFLSGALMHSTFVVTLLLLIRELYFTKPDSSFNIPS
jgi:hypothetical protein